MPQKAPSLSPRPVRPEIDALPVTDPPLPEIVAHREPPGIIIFNFHDELIYINSEGRDVLNSLRANGEHPHRDQPKAFWIPESLTKLCRQLKRTVSPSSSGGKDFSLSRTPSVLALSPGQSNVYSFRAFYLANSHPSAAEGGYILVLVERVSPSRKINLNKALASYKLSRREGDVVKLLIRGYKNREIADQLYVCIYTVEDHLKKIMKKMQVHNRTRIIATLLNPQSMP